MSNGTKSYETHFYCALCGGPFAQVLRTAVSPAQQPDCSSDDYGFSETDDSANTDVENEFNKPLDENRVIPDEVVLQNMGHAARRSRSLRLRAEEEGRRRGMMNENRTTWQAYDGRRISVKQMEWTKNLRALISRKASNQPLNHQQYLADGQLAYLTGRGLIRQVQNWADGFASIDEDEQTEDYPDDDEESQVHTAYPIIPQAAIRRNTYGFHVYQELGRQDSDYVISSIPFHDECWTLLDLAIEESGKERGINRMNERLDIDDLWSYLRGLVGVSGVKKVPNSTSAALHGEGRWEVVTRLGEVDYLEAQGSGEGWNWKHEEGFHWLVADPSSISVLKSPLLPFTGEKPHSRPPRAALIDPFQNTPTEIIHEICKMLTSTDIFSLKTASPAVHNTALPGSFYRRFLREEFLYLHTLVKEVDRYEGMRRHERSNVNEIDWRGSFERLRKLMMNPRPRVPFDEPGSEWDAIDIGLKNRNRIWKILKPMADELVEKSAAVLRLKYGASAVRSERVSVVRGFAGARSGQHGVVESVYFGSRGKEKNIDTDDEDEEEDEDGEIKHCDEIEVDVVEARIWVDSHSGEFCGIGFTVEDEEIGQDMRRFGRKSSLFRDFKVRPKKLAGFVFCLRNHIISGIQLVYEDSAYSEKMGNFNGSLRKIVAPPDWRKLVGITGFINAKGFIESIGILEETRENPAEDQFGPLPTPPLSMLPSHEQASVWKEIPPFSVQLLEREGLHVMDWRLLMAEYEIWESGFESENLSSSSGDDKVLRKIVGYYDESSLRGLKFVYVDGQTGEQTSSLLGSNQASKRGSIYLKHREAIAAVVICYGDTGVHGILFVTEGGTVSEVFGPRYLGTHKVFAPTLKEKSQTAFRQETMSRIIGLHCLYDRESRKFLQLGLIMPFEEDSIFEPPLPCAIPFDEVGDQSQVWDNGPPPDLWIIGSSPAEKQSGSLECDLKNVDYSGYAILSDLSSITIYGNMKGIRFCYSNEDKDRFFGHVDNEQDVEVQEIDWEDGERVTGIAVLKEEVIGVEKMGTEDDASAESVSSQGDASRSMQRLYFLTNRNEYDVSLPIEAKVSPDYLVAVKFDFNYHQLVSWAPIYAPPSAEPASVKAVSEKVLFPWKSKAYDISPDGGGVEASSRPICTFFDDEESHLPIDAVKGYVNSSGKFCGLLFRRGGNWEENVFGQRSGYEIQMDLQKGEKFTSMFLSKRSADALALCTNHGRSTPWFGVCNQKDVEHCMPSADKTVVGIYGTFDPQKSFFSIVWDKVGLLYRERRPGIDDISLAKEPSGPRMTGIHHVDVETGLPWFNYINIRSSNLSFTSLVAKRSHLYVDRPKNTVGRTYTLFNPAQLDQIHVLANSANRAGIKSIRFRGTKRMGLITMGEWPDREGVKLNRSQKMKISGLRGERIARIKVAFQRLEHEDRIVGIAIETTHGRSKTIVSSEMCPEKPLGLIAENVLESGEGNEIVGFHGIVSMHTIHDIGLILRKIPSTAKMPLPQEGLTTSGGNSPELASNTRQSTKKATHDSDKRDGSVASGALSGQIQPSNAIFHSSRCP
ncbi:hypothetical protein RUND412_000039 [Rhizina undulata]